MTPPQAKLADGTLVVVDDAPDDAVVPPDGVPLVAVVPADVLPVDVVPEVDVVVDEVVVDEVVVDEVVVDEVAPLGELAMEDPPPSHPIMLKEKAAAAAAERVERVVIAIAASFRSWRIQFRQIQNSICSRSDWRSNDRCG